MRPTSSSRKPLQVVVIDDVCRFALYVWRYLSRCIGFGTGDIPNDGGEISPFCRNGLPVPLETPADSARVWWVNAESIDWMGQLKAVLDSIGKARDLCFLVDVRGPYNADEGQRGQQARDALERVIGFLSDRGVDPSRDVLLVSSYHTAPRTFDSIRGQPLRIYPKSPETLERLCRRLPEPWEAIPRESRAVTAPLSQAIHILVTGAGFEFKDSTLELSRLGTRLTNSILKEGLSGLFEGALIENGEGFCCPQKYAAEPKSRAARQAKALRKAAEAKDLDNYWDELLMLELFAAMGTIDKGRPEKGRAMQREHDLREAFRRQFLADDWGFLSQALGALEIPGLTAWLTTNYTRFADRAVELKIAHAPATRSRWKIISTASEAEHLMQELLHESARPGNVEPSLGDPSRFLFKLHGDLAHLLTMAIAGHDKEIFSPLSLPIGSLHSIYTVAEQYLKSRLENEKRNRTIFWHIVGHGLNDSLLVRLIHDVCRITNPSRHRFVVVSPAPQGPTSTLRTALKELRLRDTAILSLRLRADQYLARLRVEEIPVKLRDLKSWSKKLQPLPIPS